MRILLFVFFLLLGLSLLVISCAETTDSAAEEPTAKPLNPNGDSELALLMRAMYNEAERLGQELEAGESLTIALEHKRILMAAATEPEKVASDKYRSFAAAYLQSVEELRNAAPARQQALYENLVDQCATCHRALCPGPLARIRRLE